MTTETDLEGIEVLSLPQSKELLARGCVGRVGFVVGGRPHVLPVNYAADTNGAVLFRTSATSLLMAASGHDVAFEVDGLDEAHRTGWSVCVYGPAREIADVAGTSAERLRTLDVISWAPGLRQRFLTITPQEITGRRLPVHGEIDGLGGWFPGVPA